MTQDTSGMKVIPRSIAAAARAISSGIPCWVTCCAEAGQDMLGAYVVVAQAVGLLIGQTHDLISGPGEPFEHMHASSPPRPEQAAAGVLLMHGLLADPELFSDRLPGPALGPGVVDLQGLEHLDQRPQGRDGGQADLGVLASGCGSQARHLIRAEVRSAEHTS